MAQTNNNDNKIKSLSLKVIFFYYRIKILNLFINLNELMKHN